MDLQIKNDTLQRLKAFEPSSAGDPLVDLKRLIDILQADTPSQIGEIVAPTARCICGLEMPFMSARQINTGLTNVSIAACSLECKKLLQKAAIAVCCKCNQVVMPLRPGKEPKGFDFKPGSFYHVAVCGFCSTVESAEILELYYHRIKNKIPL